MFKVNPNVFLYKVRNIKNKQKYYYVSPDKILEYFNSINLQSQDLVMSTNSIYWFRKTKHVYKFEAFFIKEIRPENIDWDDLPSDLKDKICKDIYNISISTPEPFILHLLSLYNKDRFQYQIYLINLRKKFPII